MTRTQRRRNRVFAPLVALLLVVVAWLAWERFQYSAPDLSQRPAAPADVAPRQIYFGPPNSIAVLPFESGGATLEESVPAEGLAAEIQELLIRVPALQVTARTSSNFFQGREAEPRVIAELLQSRHLLEVVWSRRSGQALLTLSLYDALVDREIWRKGFAATLPEMLSMLAAACTEIVAELPVPARECDRPTSVPDASAWTLYAKGLHHTDPSGQQDLPRAAEALRSALEIDTEYTAARLKLAEVWLHPSWDPASGGESATAAREAVDEVLRDHPQSARAWALLSFIRHQQEWDWEGAADAGRRAARLRPGDAGILSVASLAMSTVGEFGAAQEFLEASLKRDPLNLHTALRLGLLQEFVGDYEAALATYRKILVMNPDYPGGHAYRARVKVLQDKPESALRESGKEMDPFWGRYARILALSAAGKPGERPAESEDLLGEMIEENGSAAAFQIAELLAYRGDTERAFDWIGRAYAQRDSGLSSMVGNRLLENLHSDPRWNEWLKRMRLPDVPSAGD